MLLKVGVALLLLSITFAAGAAAVVGFRADPHAAPSPPIEPRSADIAPEKEKKFDPGKKLEIADDGPDQEPQPEPSPEPLPEGPRSRVSPPEGARSKVSPPEGTRPTVAPPEGSRSKGSMPEAPPPEGTVTADSTPAIADWPRPSRGELEVAREARYFSPEPDSGMTLTIEAIGIYDVPVVSSDSLEPLDRGLWHVPETSLPWDEGAQRNVYIAGHYLGYPGTASRLVFYNLDKLSEGDEIVVKDGGGGAYRYRVNESFMAGPDESWVMGQVRGRDMLTLQTCIPPDFEDRLIVRADRV